MSFLTSSGELLTRRYETVFPRDTFCMDRAEPGQQLTAVLCDPCQDKACINRCCPHGQVRDKNSDNDENILSLFG